MLKYYGYELGAQTSYEAKTGTCIVNGSHDNKKLGDILEGFIKKYVQCYACGNPETQVGQGEGVAAGQEEAGVSRMFEPSCLSISVKRCTHRYADQDQEGDAVP